MNDKRKESVIKREFSILKFRFSLRLNDILFPVDGRELAEALKNNGYSVQSGVPLASTKGRITFVGPIAQKKGITIDGNSHRGILGVTAKSCESAIAAFDELRTVIKNELKINVDDRSRFFELIAEFKCNSTKNPLESINKVFEKTKIIKDVSKISGHNISMFSLRLTSEGLVPNQEEWFDMTIEPDVIKPDSIYNISVIFRSNQKIVVEQFGKELEARLALIIDNIESY